MAMGISLAQRRTFIGLLAALIIVILIALSWIALLSYRLELIARDIDEASIRCTPSIAEDAAGHLHMAYGTAEGLMFASENDGVWTIEPIIESASYDMPSFRAASLAIDGDGWAHVASVSYWEENETWITKLMHSRNSASGWESEVICQEVSTYCGASLAIDSSSRLHIAYATRAGNSYLDANLFYATNAIGHWALYDISSRINAPLMEGASKPRIVVDNEDRPHIAFGWPYSAVYVTNLTGVSTMEIISYGGETDSSVAAYSQPSILADADGVVHVLCFSGSRETYLDDGVISITHFIVHDGVGIYENRTVKSDTEFSNAITNAIKDDEGDICLVYALDHEVGFAKLKGVEEVSLKTLHRFEEHRHRSSNALSVILRDNGEMVVSKPYRPVGYLTDSYSLSQRVYFAAVPIQKPLLALTFTALLLVAALRTSKRERTEEEKWRVVTQEKDGDHPPE
ncbi:MAG: hypothetical protein JSU93_01880 [Methanobacteriota archaeon]|nr:MAG: hypothetical protein JSU93_01880 [Euryarchaeota archaeon]